jgi:hypothetical protein
VKPHLATILVAACGSTTRPTDPDVTQPRPAIRLSDLINECDAIAEIAPGMLALRHPCTRATVRAVSGGDPVLSFVYRGPSAGSSPLASGELRQQIGLKLRAADTCNVLYVMWHIAPASGIEVSLKSNPGQHSHGECRDRGYSFLAKAAAVPMPELVPGARHTLSTHVSGTILSVIADGERVWQGQLPAAAFAVDGPLGLRSDNGEFEIELHVIHPQQTGHH